VAPLASTPLRSDTSVGMGQVVVARDPGRLRAVLGSCVGIALYHPSQRVGILAHVVLPVSSGRNDQPGRFADTAVPQMLQLLEREGVRRLGLVARITGGANMFSQSGPLQIGENNTRAVLAALKAAGLTVTGQDVGGTAGRRVTLDCATGELLVESAGKPSRSL
jgi:chemotaxis protein CheD